MCEKNLNPRRGQRRKGLGALLLVLALSLALFAFTGSAAAFDVLDQQQTSANGGNAQLNGPIPAAQSFTAGHTAPLGKISVYIGGWGAYLMRAEIWSSSGMLGATELTVPNGDTHWQDITFTPAPTLTAGTQYSIVLRWVGNSFLWEFGVPNLYSDGQASWNAGWDMCFKTYYYIADSTPPVVTPPASAMVEASSSLGAPVSFGSASAIDDVDGNLPGGSIYYYTSYGTADQVEIYSGDLFPIGTTTVTAAATDTHYNTGTATFAVLVVDTTAPVLTVPADITVDATSPVGGPASYSISATDLVDGVVTPRVVPASGSTFPMGETTVWVSAKDNAGNTSTDSFTVTVLGAAAILDKVTGQIVAAPDDPTAPGGIAPVIEASLLAKVNAATAALNRGNSNDAKVAMNDLKALINQVQAQTAKSISPEAAAAIIIASNHVIDVVSGTSLAPPVPMTTGSLVGPDADGTVWHVQVNALGSPDNPSPTLGAGTVSFTSWQSLPDGTQVKKAFTITVEYYFSVDYFPFTGFVDAGATTGICGPVVASTGGEGVPGVGDYYLFLAWDGAQGFTNPDGTVGHYPDTWKFMAWNDGTAMRNYQRTILIVWYTYGISHYYGAMTELPLWPVTEGDINIQGGRASW